MGFWIYCIFYVLPKKQFKALAHGPSSDFGQCERGKRCAMSKFFELIKFLGQHWPGFCGEKNESHFPNFLKDANPLKSDEGPTIIYY
jgi:hypothetical protein